MYVRAGKQLHAGNHTLLWANLQTQTCPLMGGFQIWSPELAVKACQTGLLVGGLKNVKPFSMPNWLHCGQASKLEALMAPLWAGFNLSPDACQTGFTVGRLQNLKPWSMSNWLHSGWASKLQALKHVKLASLWAAPQRHVSEVLFHSLQLGKFWQKRWIQISLTDVSSRKHVSWNLDLVKPGKNLRQPAQNSRKSYEYSIHSSQQTTSKIFEH